MQLERTSPEQTSIYQDAEKIVNCDSVQYIPSNGTPLHKVRVLSFFNYMNSFVNLYSVVVIVICTCHS